MDRAFKITADDRREHADGAFAICIEYWSTIDGVRLHNIHCCDYTQNDIIMGYGSDPSITHVDVILTIDTILHCYAYNYNIRNDRFVILIEDGEQHPQVRFNNLPAHEYTTRSEHRSTFMRIFECTLSDVEDTLPKFSVRYIARDGCAKINKQKQKQFAL